ncbi:MAG: hypothetical protein M3552_13790 [Planctomycetota bacterium]|nr:hypothetical protein [Planctomycetaceae bacterium]MDQ3331703.1 hypothetical protein [Planctomycetota bacterium]
MSPGQRRWTWTRWTAEAVLCLVVAYPFSGGPGKYLLGRGWITMRDWKSVYAPSQSAGEGGWT